MEQTHLWEHIHQQGAPGTRYGPPPTTNNLLRQNRESNASKQQHTTQIAERSKQEEIYWSKKDRIKWLREGERNTSFFHRSTIQHHMHNHINSLKNAECHTLENHQDMETKLVSYFEDILTEDDQNRA